MPASRFRGEEGFTLIELLIVVLIIGVLAAIALPTFLAQQKKAQNSSAKSDVRNAVSAMESCYAATEDYTQCPDAGSPLPPGVTITTQHTSDYAVSRLSKSGTTFTISKVVPGVYLRTCDPVDGSLCKTADADGNQW